MSVIGNNKKRRIEKKKTSTIRSANLLEPLRTKPQVRIPPRPMSVIASAITDTMFPMSCSISAFIVFALKLYGIAVVSSLRHPPIPTQRRCKACAEEGCYDKRSNNERG